MSGPLVVGIDPAAGPDFTAMATMKLAEAGIKSFVLTGVQLRAGPERTADGIQLLMRAAERRLEPARRQVDLLCDDITKEAMRLIDCRMWNDVERDVVSWAMRQLRAAGVVAGWRGPLARSTSARGRKRAINRARRPA